MKEYTVIYSTLMGEIKKVTVAAPPKPSKTDLEAIMMDYDWEFEKIISIEHES